MSQSISGNPTRQLHELGQRLWLDNITRELLDGGTLARYIAELSVTGLTSNPTIFEKAIAGTDAYDAAIAAASRAAGDSALSDEDCFVALALDDLRRAADLFRPVFEATDGVDGWVSMEVSPLLAEQTDATIDAAVRIHRQADRPNLFVKIPGTPAGIPAIEESIFAGVPVNVTLLFDREQYLAAAEAWMRGLERRAAAGLQPQVASVASLFVSRWDTAVAEQVPAALRNKLGIAIGGRVYAAYRDLFESGRWRRLAAFGARPQRLLWASTGTKDPDAPETLYVDALAAPDTINTLPEATLLAYADHGVFRGLLDEDGEAAEAVLRRFAQAGVDVGGLAAQLQRDGAEAFVRSWEQLMRRVADKRKA